LTSNSLINRFSFRFWLSQCNTNGTLKLPRLPGGT
jgi:hypothetical protein